MVFERIGRWPEVQLLAWHRMASTKVTVSRRVRSYCCSLERLQPASKPSVGTKISGRGKLFCSFETAPGDCSEKSFDSIRKESDSCRTLR